jgi:DGQHR domain-containing protein
MRKIMETKRKTRKKIALTPEQKLARKEQQAKNREKKNHQNEIRKILSNMGYERISGIAGVHFTYNNRTTELDDVFVYENVILLIEYTTEQKPGDHLLKKSVFYNKVNENYTAFIEFLIDKFPNDVFKKYYYEKIKEKYPQLYQLQLRILYCSRYDVSEEQRRNVSSVCFFDYHIVQYFKMLTKVIKKSAKYEFLNYLNIPHQDYAENILNSSSSCKYKGYILPESRSSFKKGYKIISFYIDAESLIRRAYVLRRESWRQEENIRLYQRMLENSKITSMRKYLHEQGRVFINNIIATISIDEIALKKIRFDAENKCEREEQININKEGDFSSNNSAHIENIIIEIKDKYNIIGIIDGQHRIYAYHEGNDIYENTIRTLRKQQNLLVTCIIYPPQESQYEQNRFEANLFLEINKNQKKINSALQQEIELIVSPFSTIAIGKDILKSLNENGPLRSKLVQYSYDKHKISTASIVSYGLRPLIKLDSTAPDSLFRVWDNPNKLKLIDKNCNDDELRWQYVEFCSTKIRDILIAFKKHLERDNRWESYSAVNKNGILGVVLINGILNVLRLLVEKNQLYTPDEYYNKLNGIESFAFRSYTSSQYRKMGEMIYQKFFV